MKSYTLENSPPDRRPATTASGALSTLLAIALVVVLAVAYVKVHRDNAALTSLQADAAGNRTEIDRLRKNVSDTESHAAALQKQLGDAQAQLQATQKDLEEAKASAAALQTKFDAAQASLTKLKPAADRAEAAARMADEKVKEAAVAQQKAVTDRDQALGQVATIRAELDAANNRANEFEQRLTQANEQIALLQKQPRRR